MGAGGEADEIMERLREWAMGEREICLLDRENSECQERVLELTALLMFKLLKS